MKNETKLIIGILCLQIGVIASFVYLWKNPEVFIKLGEKEIKKKGGKKNVS